MTNLPPSPANVARIAALQRLQSVSGPTDGLAAVEEIICQIFGSEEYALFAIDATRTRLSLVASRGVNPPRQRSITNGLIGRVARRGAAFIARRSSRIGASPDEEALTACIPLVHAGMVAGVLAIFRLLPQKRAIDLEDTELLEVLSAYGAIALSGGCGAAPEAHAPHDSSASFVAPSSSRVRVVYLYPGDVVVSDGPAELSTILGSCVAACLWDTSLKIGGMSHCLLPKSPPGQPPSLRFADAAIPALIDALTRIGARRQTLQAKLFGGGAVNGGPAEGATLGQRNVEVVRQALAEAGIRVVAEDVGGTSGRKLRFHTEDGVALVKTIGCE